MKFIKIYAIALISLLFVGCYEKFDTPTAPVVMSDELMQAQGLEHLTIAQMKGMFFDLNNSGSTNSLAETKYKRFVLSEDECTEYELANNRYIVGNYYIKGKVISNDEQGNVYKSLHIFDGTAAIELKLTNGLFAEYPCDLDTKESCWVYVRLTGLYLGSFRMMLSLGDIPTESLNAYGIQKYYANSNIVSPNRVAQFVFKGEDCTLTEGKNATDDIYVVDNYTESKTIYNTDFLGRLIRFNNLTVTYRGVDDGDASTTDYAALTSGSNTNIYPSWLCTSGIIVDGAVQYVVSKPWYKLAYSINNISLYGSVALCYPEAMSTTHASTPGFYTARTSGYSRFGNNVVPKNGATGSVLAIYAIYSHSYNFTKTTTDQSGAFQISACRFQDVRPEYYSEQSHEKVNQIDKVANLVDGDYYMAGYLTSYNTNDWSANPYHCWMGGINSDNNLNYLETAPYSYTDSVLSPSDSTMSWPAVVSIAAVDGKANTYTIKIGDKFLVNNDASDHQIGLSTTSAEWVAEDHPNSGIIFTSNGATLGTGGTTENHIHSYTDSNNLAGGVVFFTITWESWTETNTPQDSIDLPQTLKDDDMD